MATPCLEGIGCLKWERIHTVQDSELETVLQCHQPVFMEGLGQLKGYEAKINVDPKASPRFCRARPVPYALKTKSNWSWTVW